MDTAQKPAAIKRDLIADALLAGDTPEQIRERLIGSGSSPATADYELRRAEKDPFFRRPQHCSGESRNATGCFG